MAFAVKMMDLVETKIKFACVINVYDVDNGLISDLAKIHNEFSKLEAENEKVIHVDSLPYDDVFTENPYKIECVVG